MGRSDLRRMAVAQNASFDPIKYGLDQFEVVLRPRFHGARPQNGHLRAAWSDPLSGKRYQFFRHLSENLTSRGMRVSVGRSMPKVRPKKKKTKHAAIARLPGRPVKP